MGGRERGRRRDLDLVFALPCLVLPCFYLALLLLRPLFARDIRLRLHYTAGYPPPTLYPFLLARHTLLPLHFTTATAPLSGISPTSRRPPIITSNTITLTRL